MKKWIAVLFAVAVSLTAFGQTNNTNYGNKELVFHVPADNSFYRAGEFSLDAFGLVRTKNFDNEKTAAGLGVNYFFHQQVGLGLEGFCGDLNGVFVDDARAHLIFRLPIGKTAPYAFAGGGRNFELDENAVSIGLGAEHRFNAKFGIFADVRLDKLIDRGASALARTGIRFRF